LLLAETSSLNFRYSDVIVMSTSRAFSNAKFSE